MTPPVPYPQNTAVRAEPGSFRDPANRVFHAGDDVLRGLREQAAQDWRALAATDFFPSLLAAGKVCGTEQVAPDLVPADDGGPWAAVLRHERIPFVSHPAEWSFAMLRDAALLHLEILTEAVPAGFTTKDGSAWNLQFRGAEPVFIDVGSFEPAREGEPWAGYRQFCQTLLYPLLLQAHLGVDFQPWLRARVDGIEPHQMRRLFRGVRRWRSGVLTHVHLHDSLANRHATTTGREVRGQLRHAGFSREVVLATIRSLTRLVRRLDWQPPATGWSDYQSTCGYSTADRIGKERFVDAAVADAGRSALVLDLGANDGTYSRIAARHAGYVVAVEHDAAVVDRLYRRLRGEGERRILPLVMDLADPTPGVGWRSTERAGFVTRSRADVVLALALVHHLAIARNVPLALVVDWLVDLLAGAGARLVVEFVHPEDPMAQRLIDNKPAGLHAEYRRDVFERLLGRRCVIQQRRELPCGTRTLYLGTVRD
ncbi:methyltransferase [Micromonospora sp. CPCC 206060]|uniref:methyltransferase n=1 Tax=Micromonospora sp. CPCC 206060 TaxID=3122406 RepID=UPI002FF1C037